jgi:hypothetical protein
MVELAINPWQIFAPAPARFYLIPSSGAVVSRIGPTSDIATGTWQASTGSDLYAMVDETTADDSDLIYTMSASDTAELKFGTLTDPETNTGHVVRYRGKGAFTARLKEGSTTIASWSENLGSLTTVEHALTTTQADSITDYTDLRVSFET